MAYKQNFGRADIGTTGASLQNTNLINPVSTDPPTDPVTGPKTKAESNTGVDDKTKFGYITPNTGYGDAYKKRYWKGMSPIVDQKSQFTPNDNILSTDRNDNLDLSSLVTDEGSQGFSNTYNNPKTKEMMLAQTNLTSDQYDNMVIQGMQAGKVVGGNQPGSAAQYKNGTIHMGEDHQNDGALETHERVHASNFDVIQQENIKKALGSSFKQEKDAKKGYNYKNYIDQPHEQYGNFAEFREKLGLQPGSDISPEDLKILVKKKSLEENGFYKHYDNKNIVNALKTVASVTKKTDGPFSERFKRNRDSALS